MGPVANDNLYQVLVNSENGVYDMEETINRLKTYLLFNQISLHTSKSLECLKYIETIEVGEEMTEGKFTCIMFTVVQTLCDSIKNYYNISYADALDWLYHSKLYSALEREETKMWYYSNYDLFRMFLEEKETGDYTVCAV